jgi:hypothetical protein
LIQIILCDDKIFRYYIMEFFHLAVLTIASIIFIISLATIGVIMQKGARGGTFPPFASNCPDGWDSIAGQPIKTITGSVTGTILTPAAGSATIANGTVISGAGIPSGTTIISSTTGVNYNISSTLSSTMSGTLSLITPNTADKAWYTCVAPAGVNATTTGTVAWNSTGRYISYDDSTVSICDKRLWTARNNVLWDGVSNYNSC